jgi:alkaline phosphatase D
MALLTATTATTIGLAVQFTLKAPFYELFAGALAMSIISMVLSCFSCYYASRTKTKDEQMRANYNLELVEKDAEGGDDGEKDPETLRMKRKFARKAARTEMRNKCMERFARRPNQKCLILLYLCISFVWFVCALYFAYHLRTDRYETVTGHIIGAVNDHSVKLWWRRPDHETIYVEYRKPDDREGYWRTSAMVKLDPGNDHTAVITLAGLDADTLYSYRPVWDGAEQNTKQNETIGRAVDPHQYSVTTMVPAQSSVSDLVFVFGSCALKHLGGTLEGFKKMGEKSPRFGLLIGDQIYADYPTYLGAAKEDYEVKYREVLADPHFATFTSTTPVFQMFDDHEIINDWDQQSADPYPAAIGAWYEYAGSHNPNPIRAKAHYYTFDYGNVPFFVLDTRSYRSKNSMHESPRKTMLGALQLQDLKNWLLAKNSTTFKFIVSSVPFTMNSNWGDSWSSFETEREAILRFIADNKINGVLILSGDTHWGAAFRIAKGVYEFVASPIDAFTVTKSSSDESDWELFSDSTQRHFGLIRVNTRDTSPWVRFELYGENSDKALHGVSLKPSDLVVS